MAADFLGIVFGLVLSVFHFWPTSNVHIVELASCYPDFLISTHFSLLIILVGSDDGHEELLAAANAVVNPCMCSKNSAFPSIFALAFCFHLIAFWLQLMCSRTSF